MHFNKWREFLYDDKHARYLASKVTIIPISPNMETTSKKKLMYALCLCI